MSLSSAESNRLIVLGAGGHARVVIEAARSADFEIIGLTERDASRHGEELDGAPILGDDDVIDQIGDARTGLALGFGTVASRTDAGGGLRQRIFERWCARDHFFPVIISRHAAVCGAVQLGEAAQIMAGAVIQPGCEIGKAVIVNTRASIDHDCKIADHVHIAPGAILCGSVNVGHGAFIGAGATLVQGIEIGANVVIAAGAVVRKNVPANAFVPSPDMGA